MTTEHGTASQVTGSYVEFQAAVLRALPRDIDSGVALEWVNNGESLALVLSAALTLDGKTARDTYPLTVDYGMSVENAVKLGRYDGAADDEINSRNFPTHLKGTADIVVEFVQFSRYISTEGVLREFKRRGMRPAELHELLAFGEKYPDVQREFPVVALGSAWRARRGGTRRVPCLDGDNSERNLGLLWLEGGWHGFYRLAAVRK